MKIAATLNRVVIRAFREEDKPDVLGLLHAAFGRWPTASVDIEPAAFFDWKHKHSPHGASQGILAEADGLLVGCLFYMPWRSGTWRGVDLAVAQSCWGRGVSDALRGGAPDGFRWSNPNQNSLPGTIKSGRRTLLVPRYVRGGSRGGPADESSVLPDDAWLRWRYGIARSYSVVRDEEGVAIVSRGRRGLLRTATVCEQWGEPRIGGADLILSSRPGGRRRDALVMVDGVAPEQWSPSVGDVEVLL
jgi:hypothetical protein